MREEHKQTLLLFYSISFIDYNYASLLLRCSLRTLPANSSSFKISVSSYKYLVLSGCVLSCDASGLMALRNPRNLHRHRCGLKSPAGSHHCKCPGVVPAEPPEESLAGSRLEQCENGKQKIQLTRCPASAMFSHLNYQRTTGKPPSSLSRNLQARNVFQIALLSVEARS